MEGKFRANHKEIISHSEEIAFYNGNKWELNKLKDTFKTLYKHIISVQNKKFFMGVFDSMLVKFGATIVGTCALAFPIFFDKYQRYSSKNKSENTAVITKDYIQNSSLLISLAKSIGKIIVSYKDLQNLAGYLSSVNELDQVIEDLNKEKYHRKQIDENVAKKYCSKGQVHIDDHIEFNHVPIITPNGELLIEDINFKVSSIVIILLFIADFTQSSYFYCWTQRMWKIKFIQNFRTIMALKSRRYD